MSDAHFKKAQELVKWFMSELPTQAEMQRLIAKWGTVKVSDSSSMATILESHPYTPLSEDDKRGTRE